MASGVLEKLLQSLPPIVLASASPRRTALLLAAGIPHRVVVRSTDETEPDGLTPSECALHIAQQKLAVCSDLTRRELVICADTVVELDGRVLGKPAEYAEAESMLRALSGRAHDVHTAVVMRHAGICHECIATTRVWFRELPDAWIRAWAVSGQGDDKAGAYGIQDSIGLAGVVRIDGDYNNVVGLPVADVVRGLERIAARR